MTVHIGSDHAGFDLKEKIKAHLTEKGIEITDVGCFKPERCDYPDIAQALCKNLKGGRGILVCGSGIGISMAANKIAGIRCALCHDHYTAKMCRQHNDANVLAVGSRTTGDEVAKDIVDTFLQTEFEGGRHADRVKKITALEANL